MRKIVLLLWILGLALVASDLGYCFAPLCCVLLACYSLPFLAIALIRIPDKPSAIRYSQLTVFVLILALNLYIPMRHFLPDYHPKALEQLGYLFLPFFELALIAVFVIVAAVAAQFRRGGA